MKSFIVIFIWNTNLMYILIRKVLFFIIRK